MGVFKGSAARLGVPDVAAGPRDLLLPRVYSCCHCERSEESLRLSLIRFVIRRKHIAVLASGVASHAQHPPFGECRSMQLNATPGYVSESRRSSARQNDGLRLIRPS
jgi:hypothetical protein